MAPCNPLKVNRRFGGTYRLHFRVEYPEQETRVKAGGKVDYFSTLKMETTCFSETSLDFQQTTRRYIPEDSILYNRSCENLKFYMTLCSVLERHRRFGGNCSCFHLEAARNYCVSFTSLCGITHQVWL
jgi:hypothetical protein